MYELRQPTLIASLVVASDGKCELITSTWDPVTGQRRTRSITGHATGADAADHLIRLITDHRNTHPVLAQRREDQGEPNVRTLLCGCVITTTGSTLRTCAQHAAGDVQNPRS